MGRLIEIQDVESLPPQLTLKVGDVLWFAASGGRVRGGSDHRAGAAAVVQLVGTFVQSVLGAAGQIVSPAGPPNAVLFLASHAGRAIIDIVSGDPWNSPRTTTLEVTVED